uniref:B box-type domain-containing protein n=1 Tax=Cacopsylla melanoneura TaxID=428564 RepID=A0A8D8TRU5_9HEMI
MDLSRYTSMDHFSGSGGFGGGNNGGGAPNAPNQTPPPPRNMSSCSTSGEGMCLVHNKELTIWCFECKENICTDCVLTKDKMSHSTHVIISLAHKINLEVRPRTR